MATITKRKAGWLVRWYRLDGRQTGRTCPDAATARRLALDVERSRALGVDWAPAAPTGRTPLADVIAAYLADLGRTRAASTVTHAAYMLGYYLRHVGEAATLDVLSRASLASWWAEGQAAELTVSTQRNRAGAVLRLWRWASESDEYADATPRPRAFAMPTPLRALTVAPTWAECDAVIRLLRAATTGKGVAWKLATLMRYTGLRRLQAMQLTWADVDLERGVLTVRPELGKTPAERAGRVVPMAPGLVRELAGWGQRTGRLCGTTGGNGVTSVAKPIYTGVRRAIDAGQARAEAWEGRSCHGFRRAFTTELERAGASREAVEYLVGHDLGVRGRYLDPAALRLADAVALVRDIDWTGETLPRPISGWAAKITARSRSGSTTRNGA